MAVQANVVINDGKTTPVAHTFNPKGAKLQADGKDVALWRDQSPVNSLGYLSITETHAKANSNGIEKFRWVIEVPTTEVPYGATAPAKAYSGFIVIEAWVHQRATDAELKDYAAYAKNFAATTYFTDAIVKREAAW